MHDMKIAAAIVNAPIGEVARNLDRMARWTELAADRGAELICFPELNITGYCNRPELSRIALPLASPEILRISDMARSGEIVILAGLAEKGEGDRIFASHLVVHPDGRIEVYRKLHIAPPERSVFTPGNEIPLFEAAGLSFGIQLCYDAHFPELAAAMAGKGAEAIFYPHASPRGTPVEKHQSWMRHLTARAFDNSLFVIACNQTGENCNGLTFPGMAVVIGPSGDLLEKDISGREGLLVVDLKRADLENVRGHEMRYFFPNRRPELYRRSPT